MSTCWRGSFQPPLRQPSSPPFPLPLPSPSTSPPAPGTEPLLPEEPRPPPPPPRRTFWRDDRGCYLLLRTSRAAPARRPGSCTDGWGAPRPCRRRTGEACKGNRVVFLPCPPPPVVEATTAATTTILREKIGWQRNKDLKLHLIHRAGPL